VDNESLRSHCETHFFPGLVQALQPVLNLKFYMGEEENDDAKCVECLNLFEIFGVETQLDPPRLVAFHLKKPSVVDILTRLSVGRSRDRDYIYSEGKGVFPKPSKLALEPALRLVARVSMSIFGDKAAGA